MKTLLRFALVAAVTAFSAGAAMAQQGPGLVYFNDHMTTLGVAQSQHPFVAFPDSSRPLVASSPRGNGAVAESPAPGQAERRRRVAR